MSLDSFLAQAFVYLTAAVVAVPIAKRFGLGAVLGYLLAGMAIGPWGLQLVGAEGEDVMHFAEFGVVMMLFVIGLELEPKLLWRLRGPILGLGGLQVSITAALVTGIAMALGFSWNVALAIGLGLSLSSTAIVLQTLNEKGLMPTRGGQSAFSVLLFQDIAVIPMLAVMPLLAIGGGAGGSYADDDHGADLAHAAGDTAHHAAETWLTGQPPLLQTLIVLGAVAGLVLGGRYLLPPVFRLLGRARSGELFTAATLLLVIGIALLMQRVGLSPALGTFVAGVVLANSEYRHELESDIEPFKGLLLAVFFIAVGASIDFGLIRAEPGVILGLTAGMLVLKWVILFGLSRAFHLSLDQGLLFAFALPQVGEFAFVLFSFAEQEGVLSSTITSPLVAAVALSMAATPLLMLFFERALQPRMGTREESDRPHDDIHEVNPVLIVGFGDFGTTIGRFLRSQQMPATVIEFDSDRVDLLRRMGLNVYYGDAHRVKLLETAGANDAKVLIVALDSGESSVQMVEIAKKNFPHLHVIARAHEWPDAHDLLTAGADEIYREVVDTAVRAGVETLRHLGVRAHEAFRAGQVFTQHEMRYLGELHEMRSSGDQEGYIREVRSKIEELEEMFRADGSTDGDGLERDSGWDPETLRDEFGSAPPTAEEDLVC